MPLPDSSTRREIFEIQFKVIPVEADVRVDELVSQSEGYSGAEVRIKCGTEKLIISCLFFSNFFKKFVSSPVLCAYAILHFTLSSLSFSLSFSLCQCFYLYLYPFIYIQS